MTISTTRLAAVLSVVCYVAAFHFVYRDLISPMFSFWGMGYRYVSPGHFWTLIGLCIVPSVWMPLAFTRPTLLLFYMQYLLVFVPAAFVTFHSIKPEIAAADAMTIVWMMFGGLSIIQASYLLRALPLRLTRLTPKAFWLLFSGIAAILLSYTAITLGSNFRLANFTDIYSVRYAMGDLIAATGTRFGLYAQFLLLSLFLPIVFAVGIFSRRWWMIAGAYTCYVFLFGVAGLKSAILALVYLPLIYLLLSRPKQRVAVMLILGLMAVLLSGYLTQEFLSRKQNVSYLGVIHFRLFTVPALTVPQYAAFFATHPVTHLASVTGFSWFLTNIYPDIPYMIGHYYYGMPLGANSGMWAADGIAGFGVWGILLISTICAFVFWIFDSIASDMDPAFAAMAVAYCGISFTNISFFTTFITGGMGFVMATLMVAPRNAKGQIEFISRSRSRVVAATNESF